MPHLPSNAAGSSPGSTGELHPSRYKSLNGWPWGDVTVADVAEMLTQAGEAVIVTDGEKVFANHRFCAVAGRTPEEIAKDTRAVDFVLPGGRASLALARGDERAAEMLRRFRASVPKPDGTAVSVAVEVVHVRLLPEQAAVLALVRPVEGTGPETAIMQEALKHVIQSSGLTIPKRIELGKGLAKITQATTMTQFMSRYAAMGLGQLREAGAEGAMMTFAAPMTIEHRAGEAATTCDLTLGFLTGAAEVVWPGAVVVGTEVTCTSRGDKECAFRLRAAQPVQR